MTYLFFFVLLGLDQASKYWAREVLQTKGSISILGDFFHLTYVENRGAAFGLLQNQQVFFVFATCAAMILLYWYYNKQKKKQIPQLLLLRLTITAIFAGAVGNLIDRLTLGFVTDMIDVRGIWVFVFNVADIYVVCGTILLCLYILLFDKEIQ